MDNKPKRVTVRVLSLISLLIFALLLIVAYASSSVMTDSVFRRLAAGGRLHDYESADLLRAAICGVLSVAAVFPGVLGLCGRPSARGDLRRAVGCRGFSRRARTLRQNPSALGAFGCDIARPAPDRKSRDACAEILCLLSVVNIVVGNP